MTILPTSVSRAVSMEFLSFGLGDSWSPSLLGHIFILSLFKLTLILYTNHSKGENYCLCHKSCFFMPKQCFTNWFYNLNLQSSVKEILFFKCIKTRLLIASFCSATHANWWPSTLYIEIIEFKHWNILYYFMGLVESESWNTEYDKTLSFIVTRSL